MDDYSSLSIKELLAICRAYLTVPVSVTAKKIHLLDFIQSSATDILITQLKEAATQKSVTRKRPRILEGDDANRIVRRRVGDGSLPFIAALTRNTYDSSKFLELPSEEENQQCHREFYKSTSNAAVRMAVCAVCSRELMWNVDNITQQSLHTLPNKHRLQPKDPHPAQALIEGIALEKTGVTKADNGEYLVNTCGQCRLSLGKSHPDSPPPYSGANNMWIGSVPSELSCLTFPEQLLISHLYPRVYVFKLFPKGGHSGNPSTLQRGMAGTVSTFEMDLPGIISMVEGNLMPRPPEILASLLSVTFIGLGRLPKSWLRSLFRVRRSKVHEALRWLQANNPKYYRQIAIDENRLKRLPADDIPVELLGIVRQSLDEGVVVQESAGYVPTEEDEFQVANADESRTVASLEYLTLDEEVGNEEKDRSESEVENEAVEPDVIPLHVNGSVDVDLSKLSANELMAWGLANLWEDGGEGAYAVRHGRRPVNDFGQPRSGELADPDRDNYFEKAFPCLFPYGRGGIEADRLVTVDFAEHIRWALQYHDRRFRKHETFPFVAFGIHQRRQALLSAKLQMKRPNFEREARLLATITTEKLQQAAREEEAGKMISDPAVCLLRKHVHSVAGRVKGSNQSRTQLRSQIWSTCIMKNPPSLWLTINPTDLHDPIAQVFAGADIDLDRFINQVGPDGNQRAQTIASDPYASAKYFHFIIKTTLETLFGVHVTEYQVKNRMGIFGKVSAYFGMVETQGRGTLHLHLLLWLENSPSSETMSELLQSSAFRDKVAGFIKANLRVYLPGLESEETVKSIPREKDIAFNRPINPDDPDYKAQVANFELKLARTEQVHTCKLRRCLVQDRSGQYRCKRRAPFEISEVDEITEKGHWRMKRQYGYVNGYVPAILVNLRCNNDGKLLTNGEDTKNITMYTTVYLAKKQGRNYNASAVMAKGYAYHLDQLGRGVSNHVEDIRDVQRLLLFRLVHAINREQELAAPLVISYLMGWGDTYRTHHYSPVYWSTFASALFKHYPGLRQSQESLTGREMNVEPKPPSSAEEQAHKPEEHDEEDNGENVTMDIDGRGNLIPKSQVTDYKARGNDLETYNVLQFFSDTYEARITTSGTQVEVGSNADGERGRGRPRHSRVMYQPWHPKAKIVHRIVRGAGHNNLPNFIGRQLPRNDDPDTYDLYCASILMLLKPWRQLERDLREDGESWPSAFERFLSTASVEEKAIISGIQYLHECQTAADGDLRKESSMYDYEKTAEGDAMDEEELEHADEDGGSEGYTERALEAIVQAQTGIREEMHGRLAVELAKKAKIFASDIHQDSWTTELTGQRLANGTGDDLRRFEIWKYQMERDVARMNSSPLAEGTGPEAEDNNGGIVERVTGEQIAGTATVEALEQSTRDHSFEEALTPISRDELNEDQRRAYDIIVWHLDKKLAGEEPPPLRMIIHGEGGTGKSKVIQSVTEAFRERGAQHMLLKSAYTGIAASLIDGKTTHVIGGIAVGDKATDEAVSDITKAKLQAFFRQYDYLFIDEMSMLAKDFFGLLDRNTGIGKNNTSGAAFGGMSVVILGDFHQFPPVARSIKDALYCPSNISEDSLLSQQGYETYAQFKTVVTLKEQKRVTDPVWLDFLRHLRFGNVQDHHLQMLRTLIVSGGKGSHGGEHTQKEWQNAALVTPRHAVRHIWNAAALRKMCRETGRQLLVCTAHDAHKGRPLNLKERCCLESHRSNLKKKGGRGRAMKDLPYQVELAIGMKVMVTDNIETDLDITNGARGEIVDIILNENEPPVGDGAVVKLKYMPAYILVKLSRTKATKLTGLDEGIIPIRPAFTNYKMRLTLRNGKSVQRTVTRSQYPLTGAYAFTDYRSQGQTLPELYVDIAPPPSGTLSLFNLYVALSRSAGRETIRLLRGFDDEMFKKQHSPLLIEEGHRLDRLDRDTKDWYDKVVAR